LLDDELRVGYGGGAILVDVAMAEGGRLAKDCRGSAEQ
jgi:hypothetical protein